MERTYDLIVRGGTVVDGSGGPLREVDIGIAQGQIRAVGAIPEAGVEELDARGQLVTPGFVDIHTHYDGQATWEERMRPSSLHGVTTVVIGNCGVGFAPCRPHDRNRLIRLMEGVEDIPFPVLDTGLPWTWEHFSDYLDRLDERRFDVDIGTQLPHAALRVYVMGERGENREPATEADIAAMAAIAGDAMEAGALGFSTSRTLNHRTSDGRPTPTLRAEEAELTGIALGLARRGKGVLQVVSDFSDVESEFGIMRRIVAKSGRPLSFSLTQHSAAKERWRWLLSQIDEAVAAGLPMKAQVCGRPVGILFGLELTMHPFSRHPSFRALAGLPLPARVARLRTPEFRAQLLSEQTVAKAGFLRTLPEQWHNVFLLGDRPDYEQPPSQSVAALARARGLDPYAVALDQLLANEGRGMLYLPFLNYADGSLDPSYEMLRHPHTVPGLSDGGAHVGMICDGSFPTSNLTHWTRDRTRGPKLPLEQVVRMQTRSTAEAVGLFDRGLIAPGMRADLNVIDYDALTLSAPEVTYDLPAGGRRLMQRAHGYTATMVAGHVTYRNGEETSALPGRLIRGTKENAR